jgi:predicted nucleic acid-binding protein
VTIVLDASVVVAALVDGGEVGAWAEDVLRAGSLTAPHHLPVEVANILRRAAATGDLTPDTASLAHADLLDLRLELVAYAPLADRVWELRENVTAYDAWYVALAERLGAPLATLDQRLTRAAGPRCEFTTPW